MFSQYEDKEIIMPVSHFDGQEKYKVKILPHGGQFILKSEYMGYVSSVGTFFNDVTLAKPFNTEDEAKIFAGNYDLTVIESSA